MEKISHEQPLAAAVMLRDDLPRRIHQLPENAAPSSEYTSTVQR